MPFSWVECAPDNRRVYTGKSCRVSGYWCKVAVPSARLLHKSLSFFCLFVFAAATTAHKKSEVVEMWGLSFCFSFFPIFWQLNEITIKNNNNLILKLPNWGHLSLKKSQVHSFWKRKTLVLVWEIKFVFFCIETWIHIKWVLFTFCF